MSTCDVIIGVIVGAWLAGLLRVEDHGRRLGDQLFRRSPK